MQDTGYTKTLDNLGRILIPKKLRQQLNLAEDDKLSMYLLSNYDDGNSYLCLRLPQDKQMQKIKQAKALLKELDIPLPKELDK